MKLWEEERIGKTLKLSITIFRNESWMKLWADRQIVLEKLLIFLENESTNISFSVSGDILFAS